MFKKRSKAGKENRKKLEVSHTSGSKSYEQRLYEMDNPETNVEPRVNAGEELVEDPSEVPNEAPTQVKLYYKTHRKKDHAWVSEKAKENYDMMITLWKQSIEDGDELAGDHILEQVLETKSGYTRGRGYGVKLTSSTSAKEAIRFQTQRDEAAERRVEEFYDEVQTQRLTIAKLEESQLQLQNMMQSLLARFDATNH